MSLDQEIPLLPWSKLATDILHFEGASYLLIVDYTCRFPVVHKLSSMTGQHITNWCKLIFSEFGWPETLISDNGPWYTPEAFTSVMKAYHVNHITNSLHYPQSNGLAEKYVQIVKSLFQKAKEDGKDLFNNHLWQYPLTGSLQSLMQILQSRNTRPDVPMSNAARKQLGLHSEDLRNTSKHEHLPSHDLHVGQDVMFQDATSKQWYPATITSLCAEPRSNNITTREGATFRKTQAHLKPYTPQDEKLEAEHSVLQLMTQSNDMQTVKQPECKKSYKVDNQAQSYTRPKRDIKPPVRFDS